jgi:hypothetical protein
VIARTALMKLQTFSKKSTELSLAWLSFVQECSQPYNLKPPYIHTHVHTSTYAYTHIYIHSCTHAHTHTYTGLHTHEHIHTQNHTLNVYTV